MPKNEKMLQSEIGGAIGEGAKEFPNSVNERITPPTDDYPKIISHVNTGGATEGATGPNSPASFRETPYDEKLNPETNLRAQFVSDTVEKTEGRI